MCLSHSLGFVPASEKKATSGDVHFNDLTKTIRDLQINEVKRLPFANNFHRTHS